MSTGEVPTQRGRLDADGVRTARYELFLGVAQDLNRVTTAYDAELMVSTLLGAAYSVADSDRTRVLNETAEGLLKHLARRRTRPAVLLRTVLGIITEQRGRSRASAPADPPAWLPHVGAVHPTAAYAFGDHHGIQLTYLATFAYTDETVGGPEHVLAAVVDRRLGHVKDLFIAAPAAAILAQLEAAAAADPNMRMIRVGPEALRPVVETHLLATDALTELPEARSLTSDRALAAHRLRLLPSPADFSTAPEAARLADVDEETLDFALRLIGDYADQGVPAWDPATVADFLLNWTPAKALLDRTDIAVLPDVLSAWVRWAGRVGGQKPHDVAQSVAAVARHRREFARLARTGARRSPATHAMAQLLSDGVDPSDEQAVSDWLDDYNAREREPDQHDNGGDTADSTENGL